ncbi:MAG: homoserine O-acetyltransferase [Thermoanaerobaculia bacterium]|nr:homoserine O-acetyltransferase [Thermoanaerobaculia bacterium]
MIDWNRGLRLVFFAFQSMATHERLDHTFIADPPKTLELSDGFQFSHDTTIDPFVIVYETYGELSKERDNAVLVCHALSPSAHAAGKYSPDDEKAGWWDSMIGYGKPIDLDEHFVICVNFPGSCWGTTGPASIEPRTGKPYGSSYPWVTIQDMVEAERLVVDHLGIEKLASVVGGSLGGMQVFMWAAMYPERVRSLISMAAAAAVPVEGIGWHIIGRKIIEADPDFDGGDYYDHEGSLRGLEVARMVGHMTYLSLESLESKFGRRRRHGTRQFEIDSYFEYQGKKFASGYDANSYIRIQAAMDEMDLEEQYESLTSAFGRFRAPALLISFTTDWLFPPREVAKVHDALESLGIDSTHLEIDTPKGHDAFLIDYDLIGPPVRNFLGRIG